MNAGRIKEYRDIIVDSFDIIDNLIIKTSYPTIIMDNEFQIIFVNNLALKLYDTSFEETFTKNYLGLYCNNADEYEEFRLFYKNIKRNKKPVYVNNDRNNSYIMIFPIMSPSTGEVIYFHNIFIVEEFHMTTKQIDDLVFNIDFAHFAHQISILIENKDKYTANHSSNVVLYSELIGKEIGLDGITLNKLKLAAGMHDIGKVSIPNNILNKNGRLNEIEYIEIKKHAYYSGKILDALDKFRDVALGALYHHERYDGKGYPTGLKEEEIPLFARIIAIADTFDAMTTDRPYRKAMPFEKAINELVENKYTQFDPYLIDKFINLDLKTIMNTITEFDSQYTDKYTISNEDFERMSINLREKFAEIDPYIILENLVDNDLYGLIISKDLKYQRNINDNRFEILYQSNIVDKLCKDSFIQGNWEMCLKEKRFAKCNYCPADGCLSANSIHFKKSKLINNDGISKYLNTILYPVYDSENGDILIIELLRDVTTTTHYSNTTSPEFFDFTDNIFKIFAEQYSNFSVIYREMRSLCNWIAKTVEISDHKIERMNKAISICDLGIIALIDSNECNFESLISLRTSKKHIEIIHNMISNLETFNDISDIVLYHHTEYNDINSKLCGDNVPIQSYIISVSDILLTHTVTGKPINETIEYVRSMSGIIGSPQICETITNQDNVDELVKILQRVSTLNDYKD